MDNTATIKKPTIEEYFGIPEIPDTMSVDLKQISNEIDELRKIANQWKGIAQRFVDIYGSLREDEENEDED